MLMSDIKGPVLGNSAYTYFRENPMMGEVDYSQGLPSMAGLEDASDYLKYLIPALNLNLTGMSGEGLGQSSTQSTPTLIMVSAAFSIPWAVALGYHGYKRNRGSVGWAAAWAAFGVVFGVIPFGIALAQGYAKPAKK